jgi:hypothetical protein
MEFGELLLHLTPADLRFCWWLGDKSGSSEKRFYKQLIKMADSRFADHLIKLTEQQTDDN